METRSILGGSKMRHFNERFDAFRVGLQYAFLEIILAPIFAILILLDIAKGVSMRSAFEARCLDPIKNTIKREVRWRYHPEEDPVFRKLKGL